MSQWHIQSMVTGTDNISMLVKKTLAGSFKPDLDSKAKPKDKERWGRERGRDGGRLCLHWDWHRPGLSMFVETLKACLTLSGVGCETERLKRHYARERGGVFTLKATSSIYQVLIPNGTKQKQHIGSSCEWQMSRPWKDHADIILRASPESPPFFISPTSSQLSCDCVTQHGQAKN